MGILLLPTLMRAYLGTDHVHFQMTTVVALYQIHQDTSSQPPDLNPGIYRHANVARPGPRLLAPKGICYLRRYAEGV